ncbi:hypothetical protein [Desulfoscipio gibsoniae]|uniref:Uncharacterized protein n=1 Tax=Desulfoscipio gibsoniae DSM 7213 TaxID=767817 RepID=R4KEW2_9FIRM|nr:hypothetical protein [Desulfoscipio gibsoniae]AGL01124.1 hypothetical protein Desgi_1653 [Desulfoscipio gibsoniae DSM 7213]
MRLEQNIMKHNPNIEFKIGKGYGFAVTYDSLFENDYVVNVFTGGDVLEMLADVYSPVPLDLRKVQAIAKTKDGNIWCYCDSKIGPLWLRHGGANAKLMAAGY